MPDTARRLGTEIEVRRDDPTATGPVTIDRPPQLGTVLLCALLALAVLTACYEAAEIVLPIVLGFVLNLVFQPVLRWRI